MLNNCWRKLLIFFAVTTLTSQIAFANLDNNGLGVSSLMSAIIDEDIDGVKFFINTNSQAINQKNIGGATPLHLAARIGNLEIVKLLIENGADVNVADNEKITPLMRASIAGYDEVVKLLLQYKANASNLSSVDKSVIYYSTYASCANCLNNLFLGYDFKGNMTNEVLNQQLSSSYEIAKNRDDLIIQKILENYLSQKDAPEEKTDAVDSVKKEETENELDKDKLTYVLDIDKNGEVTEFKKVTEVVVTKEDLLNISDSSQVKQPEKPQIQYRLKIGEDSKKPDENKYFVISDKKQFENESQTKSQDEIQKDKVILYKLKKVQEDQKIQEEEQKIQKEKNIEQFSEQEKIIYKFIKGESKSETGLKNEAPTNKQIIYQLKTNNEDKFLQSFDKVFKFKPADKEEPYVKKEIIYKIIKNNEKIEGKKNYIFKQKISNLEKNQSDLTKDNQDLSKNNQHFYYENNEEAKQLSQNNSRRYYLFPNI